MYRLLFICLFITTENLSAQIMVRRDPSIEKMVNLVSADSLQSYIKAMVSFGTRNTLSSGTHPNRGIGAARNWVLGKFNDYPELGAS